MSAPDQISPDESILHILRIAEGNRRPGGTPYIRKDIHDALQARVDELEADNDKLRVALEFIDSRVCWEINPSNYDHDLVCQMNTEWSEVGNVASDALLPNTREGE